LRELFWRGRAAGENLRSKSDADAQQLAGRGRERRERRVGRQIWEQRGGDFACRGRNPGNVRRAEAGLSCCASRKGEGGQEAMWEAAGRSERLPDEASEVEETGKGIADEGGG